MLWSKKQETAVADKHYSELLVLAGIPKGQGLDHFELRTANAIDPKKRKVLLLVGKVAKTYSYDDSHISIAPFKLFT